MKLIINWFISALVILIVASLLPGIHIATFTTAIITALVLGIINAIIRPILLVLTLPITILTLGLFTLVINACLILLTAQIVPGFEVDGFLSAIIFSIVLSFSNTLVHFIKV